MSTETFELPPVRVAADGLPPSAEEDRGPAPPRRARDRVGSRSFLASACKLALPLVAAAMLFFQLSVVRGASMSPGIHDGDRILIDPVRYWIGDVARGDIVVLRCPLDPRLM